jgi:hypothetical protein
VGRRWQNQRRDPVRESMVDTAEGKAPAKTERGAEVMVAKRMSVEEFEKHQAKVNRKSKAALFSDVIAGTTKAKSVKGSKYGNIAETVDGVRHASRKEMRRYHDLGLLLKCGSIHFLARQVRFILPSGIEYICDFMTGCIKRDDIFPEMVTLERVIIEDVKSSATERNHVYRMKRKLMLGTYGIEIKEV